MRYSIRQALESDIEPMMHIGHEGIRPYVEQLWGWDQADQERRFRENFDLTRIKIVMIDGQDVGYLDVENHYNHVFLAGIYIDRQYRRRGIGAELIGDILSSCRSLRKPLRLRVLCSYSAQHLYARLGFRQVEVTETHIYMEAALGA